MSQIFTHLCIWIAGLVSGLWFAGLISGSRGEKGESKAMQYCVALFVPLLCTALFVLLMAVFAELLSQVSLAETAKRILSGLKLVDP